MTLYEIQFVRDSLNAIVHSRRRWSRLNGFVGARDQSLCACEEMYQGLLSQIARVCALADGFVSDRDHPYPLAGPIVRGSNELLARYRRLISEAALSCFSGGKARRDFVAGFGYVSPPDWLLPYWPLLAIFVLDIALFVIPITFHLVPGGDFITIEPMLLFLLGHALLQLVSVGWAVFPKARCSILPDHLCLHTPGFLMLYSVICSAATAVLVMWINTAALNFVTHGGLPKLNGLSHYTSSAIFSVYFPAITCCTAFLTDWHLRHSFPSIEESDGYIAVPTNWRARYRLVMGFPSTWAYRVRDALVMAFLLAALNIVFVRQAIWLKSGIPSPDKYVTSIAGIVAAIGGAVGLLLPVTAAAYLAAAADDLAAGRRPSDPRSANRRSGKLERCVRSARVGICGLVTGGGGSCFQRRRWLNWKARSKQRSR